LLFSGVSDGKTFQKGDRQRHTPFIWRANHSAARSQQLGQDDAPVFVVGYQYFIINTSHFIGSVNAKVVDNIDVAEHILKWCGMVFHNVDEAKYLMTLMWNDILWHCCGRVFDSIELARYLITLVWQGIW